jgi:hypothetical protein
MKNVLRKTQFCLLMVVMSFGVMASNYNPEKLPNEVKQKIQSLYPGVEGRVDWTKKMNKYQADFIYNDKSVSLLFDKKGALLNSKIEIDSSEVPIAVLNAIKNNYLKDSYKIVYLMKRWQHGEAILYETAIMKGRKIYILRNDDSGKLTNEYVVDKIDILNPYYGKD